MPYDPDTGVAEGLIHILDRSIGRRRAAILLHDYLAQPGSGATRHELIKASNASINTDQTVKDSKMTSRVTFRTTIGKRSWDGDRIDIPAIPATMALAVIGRPLNSVIDHPLMPPAPISGVEGDQKRHLIIKRRDVSMRSIRPPLYLRALTEIRVLIRDARLARQIYAHEGLSLMALMIAFFVFMPVSILTGIVALANEWTSPLAIAFLAGILSGMVTAWIVSALPRRIDVQNYLEDADLEIIAKGHSGTANFND